MSDLLIKFRSIIFIAMLTIALISWAGLWVGRQKEIAVTEFKQQVDKSTTEQIKKDEITVIDAFKPSNAIADHADGLLSAESKKTSVSGGLLSTKTDPEADRRRSAKPDSVLPASLSDIDFNEAVRRHADVLQ